MTPDPKGPAMTDQSGGHTAGRWSFDPADMFGDHNIVLADSDNRLAIAAVVSNLREAAEVQANARLIAAAPDLLAALVAAESLFAHTFAMNGTIHKQMRAAITLATGAAS